MNIGAGGVFTEGDAIAMMSIAAQFHPLPSTLHIPHSRSARVVWIMRLAPGLSPDAPVSLRAEASA
jgi:hypothetical protein